jgi:hypothetical protein
VGDAFDCVLAASIISPNMSVGPVVVEVVEPETPTARPLQDELDDTPDKLEYKGVYEIKHGLDTNRYVET